MQLAAVINKEANSVFDHKPYLPPTPTPAHPIPHQHYLLPARSRETLLTVQSQVSICTNWQGLLWVHTAGYHAKQSFTLYP